MSEQDSISFKAPNGSAFVTTETRSGPPLSFIGDKIRQSLVYTHMAAVAVRTYIPDDFPQPPAWQATKLSVKDDGLMEPIRASFRENLTSFLSLYNMLALESENGLVERLLSMSSLHFRSWLGRIAAAGSVQG